MDATAADSATPVAKGDKNVVQVQIFGHPYVIRGEADQAYILEVAAFVDRRMREITEKLPVASLSKVAILASLNIADELFKERASRQQLGADAKDRAARLAALLDEVLDERS
jgi:cell division protein ZapA